MLYLHRLLHMSSFSKISLTATLALSVLLWLVGSKTVRANGVADCSTAPQVKETLEIVARSVNVEPLNTTFDPEPNAPPKRTGGSGTR